MERLGRNQRLRHRHLVDLFEVGEVDGRWFWALEWCDGGHVLGARAPVERLADEGWRR